MGKHAATTLLVTGKCPLNCRYCNIADELDEAVKSCKHEPTFEEMDAIVRKFLDDNQNCDSKAVTLSGGEPFVRWPDIKKLIEKYGRECTFDFNTSGYLLTEEILEWLSQYSITWNLSVDGGELVTNYLRPLRNPNSTAPTYWQKLKEIAPTLLWYFPYTYCKIIISRKTVKYLYNSYLELEQIGFKRMFLILDLTERADEKQESLWTEQDYAALQDQLNLIEKQRAIGMKIGVERMALLQVEEILESILKEEPVTAFDLKCSVLDHRQLNSMLGDDFEREGNCYEGMGLTFEKFKSDLIEGLKGCNGRCPNDPSCSFFKYCVVRCCPRDNMAIRSGPWNFEYAFCNLAKCLGNSAIYFLSLCNEYCAESPFYQRYLGGMI